VITEQISPIVQGAYEQFFGAVPEDGRISKDVALLMKKLPNYLPIVTNALFRFFDADGSGTISKEEIVISFGGLFGGENGGPSKAIFIPAVFRMIDENGNGSIEAVEVQPLLTEVITSIAKVVLAIIDQLEKDLKVSMKNKALKKLQDMVDEAIAGPDGMPWPIPASWMIDMLKAKPLSFYDVQGYAQVMEILTPEIIAGWDSFVARFRAAAGEGKSLPIRKAAALFAEIVVGPISAFCDPDLAAAMLPMATAGLDLPIPLEMLDLSDMLKSGTAVMSAYLKSGGVKRFFEAFLSFLDINNDSDISEEELTSLWDPIILMKEAGADAEKRQEAMIAMFGAFLKIIDSDGSGTFDMDDAPKLYDKVAELAVAMLCLNVELIKSVAVAVVLPALNIAFQMFTEDGSITNEMVEGILG